MSLLTRCKTASLLLLSILSPTTWAAYTINMAPGVTEISREIYQLHMIIFWICVAIGLIVFSVMFYAIIFHRKSLGATPATFHESTLVEIIWSVIPLIILVLMAIPATKLLIKMEDTATDSDMTIKITGYQWFWEYDYRNLNIRFMSHLATDWNQVINRDIKSKNYLLEVDEPLVVPTGKKIRILATSNDVQHSWWVPALGVKRDTIPGFINESWTKIDKPGIYRGQCAELCGAKHGFMPIVVDARSPEEFEKWVEEQQQNS